MYRINLAAPRDSDGGAAAVEFALVAPILILLTVGLIYLCAALFIAGSMTYAVEEGARCASVKTAICPNAGATIAYTQSRYFAPGAPVFTYAADPCGNAVSASINYAMNLGLTSVNVPISATACYP
jgi:K+-transporting ATPase c subunit